MHTAIKSLNKLKNEERVVKLNDLLISGSAAQGDKKSFQQIKSINKELKDEQRVEDVRAKFESGKITSSLPLLETQGLKEVLTKVEFNGR